MSPYYKYKKEYRKEVLEKQENLDSNTKTIYDDSIFKKLIGSKEYKAASVIFTFVSYKNEVDTHKFIEYALGEGKIIGVPRVISKEEGMEVCKIEDFNDLEKGYYGILEPKNHCDKISHKDIDLVIMPGVAFDKERGRIGYGGGFYDRFLKTMDENIPKIALGYDFQIYDVVPIEEFDVKPDKIITPHREF